MEENKLLSNLYFNPLDNASNIQKKEKGFHLKEDKNNKNNDENLILKSPKKLNSQIMGSVIMQNWETKKDIPSDIGELIHYPIFIDRKKYKQEKDDSIKALPIG